jgi:hypothetical protein
LHNLAFCIIFGLFYKSLSFNNFKYYFSKKNFTKLKIFLNWKAIWICCTLYISFWITNILATVYFLLGQSQVFSTFIQIFCLSDLAKYHLHQLYNFFNLSLSEKYYQMLKIACILHKTKNFYSSLRDNILSMWASWILYWTASITTIW